ncbi:MAG TPA: hypothetical protein VJ952_07135, partial [Opitutales bacterium]|nr:hypothetical protein [Opitutales bacterium]
MHTFQKQLFRSVLLALSLTAYTYAGPGHDHGHAHDDHAAGHEEQATDHEDHAHDDHDDGPEPVVVTQYTEQSELFMEHPPLLRGESATLIIHLTRLSD